MKDQNGIIILCGNNENCKFRTSCYRSRIAGPKQDFYNPDQTDCEFFLNHDPQDRKD